MVAKSNDRAAMLELVADADAFLTTYYRPVDGELMDAMPRCRAGNIS